MRPKAFTLDRDTSSCTDPVALREGALSRYGELHIRTGNEFLNQWHSKYYSQVFPFVIPRMVSGPDFDPQNKWRRRPDAPFVTSQEFTRGVARRVEAQCRNDWLFMPSIRSVDFIHTAEHTMSTVSHFSGKRGAPSETRANEMVPEVRKCNEANASMRKQLRVVCCICVFVKFNSQFSTW